MINTPPSLALKFGTRSLRKALKRGLPITVRTNEDARLTVRLLLARKLARRLGVASLVRPVTVGGLQRSIKSGRSTVRVKFSKRPAGRLKRLVRRRKLRRLRLNVRTTVRDSTGLTTTKTSSVTLKR